jgi:hypothetical protein
MLEMASQVLDPRDRPRWTPQIPISQSRGYTSPDPSPISVVSGYATPYNPQRYPPMTPQYPPQQFILPAQQVEIDPYYYPELPKRRTKTRKAEQKQPTFLTKLFGILAEPEYHDIIRWDEAGEIIIIERPDELAKKVLPLVYRQSRFASFSRQLNVC